MELHHQPGVQSSPTSVNDIMEGATSAVRIDQAKAEAFGSRMLTLLNHGALTLMISLGHKTRLFEVMATLPAATSAELAKAANLHERYVREWLATMYVGGIVVLDDSTIPNGGGVGGVSSSQTQGTGIDDHRCPHPETYKNNNNNNKSVKNSNSNSNPCANEAGDVITEGDIAAAAAAAAATIGSASAAAGGKHGPGGLGFGVFIGGGGGGGLHLSSTNANHPAHMGSGGGVSGGGGIFSADTRFVLPAENAAFLTWGRGPENVAVLSQYISILSSFEGRVEECFRRGRGINHAEYTDLKAIMAADSAQTIASSLVDWILPLGPNSLIQDLRAGIDVLDVQCGTGVNLLTMAKEFPKSWFTGYDDNLANIALASDAALKDKLHNVRFKCMRVTNAMETSAYDLITCFGSLVDTGEIANTIHRIYHALRPAGTFLLQDVAASSHTRDNKTHPAGPLLYAISVMYSIPAALDKTGSDDDAVGVMWGNDRALHVIRNAGFKCDKPCYLPEDHCNAFFFCFKD